MEDIPFLQPILDGILWLGSALFEVMVQATAVLALVLGFVFFEVSREVIEMTWAIAQPIIEDLNLSSYIQTAWTAIGQEYRAVLAFFRIPEILNLLFSAGVTKFALRFIPFM